MSTMYSAYGDPTPLPPGHYYNPSKTLPVSPYDIGKSLDVCGFHCLVNYEAALIYKRVIDDIALVGKYVCMKTGKSTTPPTVIVPVIVEAAHIFAVGNTPTEVYNSNNTPEVVPTYVSTQIHITPEAFETAMNDKGKFRYSNGQEVTD